MLRFWEHDHVESRYYTSDFLGHAAAIDLVKSFEANVENKIGFRHLIQISMDGPNVNWATFDRLQRKLQLEYSSKLLSVGSCGIHIVHNAFKAAISKMDGSYCTSCQHYTHYGMRPQLEEKTLNQPQNKTCILCQRQICKSQVSFHCVYCKTYWKVFENVSNRLAYDSFPGKGSWRFIENYNGQICKEFLCTFVYKIQAKNPLAYILFGSLSSLDPFQICNDQERCIGKFRRALNILHSY